MSRYVNADGLYQRLKKFKDSPCVNVVPSADVVEVVRCKDCEHHEEYCFDDSKLLCWAHDIDIVVSPTDYCSWGERKEQEE